MTSRHGESDCSAAIGLADPHWNLLFGVRRSVRYHRRRERFLDAVHNLGALITAISGSGAVMVLLSDLDEAWAIGAAAIVAVAGAVEVVLRPAKFARLHSELARDFIGLEKEMLRQGGTISDAALADLEVMRLEIEAREPPALRVLDAMCHDELVTALGIRESERADPKWYQRMLAQVFDVGAHRLHKRGSH